MSRNGVGKRVSYFWSSIPSRKKTMDVAHGGGGDGECMWRWVVVGDGTWTRDLLWAGDLHEGMSECDVAVRSLSSWDVAEEQAKSTARLILSNMKRICR